MNSWPKPRVEFVSVCSELEIGLGVRRDPARIVSLGGKLWLVQPRAVVDRSV